MGNVFSTVGMLVIILGWGLQIYYSVSRKVFAISLRFLGIYVVGCILLIIDGLQTGNDLFFLLNLVTAILAILAGYYAHKARR